MNCIAPAQLRSEWEEFASYLAGAKTVLEIGCDLGGTLFLLAAAASDDATVLSIDVSMSRARKALLYPSFARRDQQVIPLRGDSQVASTVERVHQLGIHELDVLFIDGDHSYNGVCRDYELWAPLVRLGGLVALHDVNPGPLAGDVPSFWKDIGGGTEIIHQPPGRGLGIGLRLC